MNFKEHRIINKIKRLAIRRKLRFTFKAECELLRCDLTEDDVVESIMNAPDIKKVLNPRAPMTGKLYVIEAPNFDGLWIYTKGKFMKNGEEFYVLISSKLNE